MIMVNKVAMGKKMTTNLVCLRFLIEVFMKFNKFLAKLITFGPLKISKFSPQKNCFMGLFVTIGENHGDDFVIVETSCC
jgi:hypothetical protein